MKIRLDYLKLLGIAWNNLELFGIILFYFIKLMEKEVIMKKEKSSI
jgi:hypothetical protein